VRPEWWTRNLFVLSGVLFGGHLLDVPAMLRALAAFALFCALSGVVYIFNDLADRAADQQHPLKRLRPIASGRLSPPTAAIAATILGVVSLAAAVLLSPMFAVLSATYVALLIL